MPCLSASLVLVLFYYLYNALFSRHVLSSSTFSFLCYFHFELLQAILWWIFLYLYLYIIVKIFL